MRIVKNVLLVLLVLMCLAAGVPKIMQMPQELEFLAHIGLSPLAVSIVGVIQFSAGVLLVPPKTRVAGAILAALMLALSATALFIGGNMGMGFITLVPIGVATLFIIDGLSNGSGLAKRGAA